MIKWLQREIERKDTLLMYLMQRVPELEAAPEPRESPETSSESDNKGVNTRHPYRRTSAVVGALLLRVMSFYPGGDFPEITPDDRKVFA
jgi:hypothetical protein